MTFEIVLSMDIGQYILGSVLLPFLCTGVTVCACIRFACVIRSGYVRLGQVRSRHNLKPSGTRFARVSGLRV